MRVDFWRETDESDSRASETQLLPTSRTAIFRRGKREAPSTPAMNSSSRTLGELEVDPNNNRLLPPAVPGSARACEQTPRDDPGEDEITPEARPSPCPVTMKAPQKAHLGSCRKRASEGVTNGTDGDSPTKLSKLEETINKFRLPGPEEQPSESAEARRFKAAHAARWGAYLLQITPQELAQTVIDTRRLGGAPMCEQETAACLPACAEYLSSPGSGPSGPSNCEELVQRLCSLAGAEALGNLLNPVPELAALNDMQAEDSETLEVAAKVEERAVKREKKKKKKAKGYKAMMASVINGSNAGKTSEQRAAEARERIAAKLNRDAVGTSKTFKEHRFERI